LRRKLIEECLVLTKVASSLQDPLPFEILIENSVDDTINVEWEILFNNYLDSFSDRPFTPLIKAIHQLNLNNPKGCYLSTNRYGRGAAFNFLLCVYLAARELLKEKAANGDLPLLGWKVFGGNASFFPPNTFPRFRA